MSEIVDEPNPTQLSDNRISDSINTPSTRDLHNIPAAYRLNGKKLFKVVSVCSNLSKRKA